MLINMTGCIELELFPRKKANESITAGTGAERKMHALVLREKVNKSNSILPWHSSFANSFTGYLLLLS